MFNRFFDYLFGDIAETNRQRLLTKRLDSLIKFAESHIEPLAYEHWVEKFVSSLDEKIMSDPVILVTEEELIAYKLNPNSRADENLNFDLERYLLTLNKDDIRQKESREKEEQRRIKENRPKIVDPLDNDRMKIHCCNRQFLEDYWAIEKNTGTSPFYRSPGKFYMIPYPALRDEVAATLIMLEHIENDSNGVIVHNQKFLTENQKIPEQYICAFSGMIMTYPVDMDGKIVDFFELIKWWMEDSNRRSINPLTNKPIRKIIFQDSLYHELHEFVTQLQLALMAKQLTNVKAIAACFVDDTDTVQNRRHAKNLPAEYYCLLSEKIMTHPVILDGLYAIDLNELQIWWTQHPEFHLKNPITGTVITQMEYCAQLKIKIDRLTKDPVDQQDHTRPGGSPGEMTTSRIGFVPYFIAYKSSANFLVPKLNIKQTTNPSAGSSMSPRHFAPVPRALQTSTARGLAAILEDAPPKPGGTRLND